MEKLKELNPFLFALLLLAIIAGVMLLPIDTLLLSLSFTDFQVEYFGLTIKMGVLFIMALILINKFQLYSISGLSVRNEWKNKLLNALPVYLFIIGILNSFSNDLTLIELSNVLLLLIACLTVGFAEEFMFRGLLQPLFLKKYIDRPNGIMLSISIAAVFFGLFHLLNLVKGESIMPVLVQVVYASFIGFFFGVLLLRTNKLVPIAITHGMINFFFSINFLPGIAAEASTDVAANDQLSAAIGPLIIFTPLLIAGLFIVKKIDRQEIVDRIED